jgi:hypothetical protein
VRPDIEPISRGNSAVQRFWLVEQSQTLVLKHEVWKDSEGLTTLCLADERGEDCRKLSKPGSKLIHSFYAESHYDNAVCQYEGRRIYAQHFVQ